MFFSLSSDIRCVISIIIFFERIQLWQQNAAADAPKRKSLRKKWLKKQQRRKSQRRNNFDTLDEKRSAFDNVSEAGFVFTLSSKRSHRRGVNRFLERNF